MAEGPDRRRPDRARDERTGGDSAAARIRNQTQWVDLQIKRAMERGEFDNLPGAGKPLGDLGSPYDRDWWLKKLIERERISVLPAALQLRKDDAELDALLDREATEKQVRTAVEDFNRRIVEARRQLQGGPPVVTPTRDVDTEVERWRERRRPQRTTKELVLVRSPRPRDSPGVAGGAAERLEDSTSVRRSRSARPLGDGHRPRPLAPSDRSSSAPRKVSSNQPLTLPTTPAVSCTNRPRASEVLLNDSV